MALQYARARMTKECAQRGQMLCDLDRSHGRGAIMHYVRTAGSSVRVAVSKHEKRCASAAAPHAAYEELGVSYSLVGDATIWLTGWRNELNKARLRKLDREG